MTIYELKKCENCDNLIKWQHYFCDSCQDKLEQEHFPDFYKWRLEQEKENKG